MAISKTKEKGFTTVDISIAMIVVTIFVTIMSSMIYSVYLSSTEAKRTSAALNYAVDIFEDIGQETFSILTPEKVLRNLEDKLKITEIKTSSSGQVVSATGKIGTYNIKLEMTIPYTDGTIKRFKLTITYPVSAKKNEEKLELERIRTITNKLKTNS